MGDQIFAKDKELQLKQEREYIAECIEKDQAAAKQDLKKKINIKRKHQEMCNFLDGQVLERRQRTKQEADGNQMYMEEWNAKMDHAYKLSTEKE